MADSDPVAVWVVDDSEQHQVLDAFLSTRQAVNQHIEQTVALCAFQHRWTMEVTRIALSARLNGAPGPARSRPTGFDASRESEH